MCGLWALFLNKIGQNTELIEHYKTLFDKVKVRGPDESSFNVKENNIIGFHRLAINGLDAKYMQPFVIENDNKIYTLICNGEIYNHKKLEKELYDTQNYTQDYASDCCVLLPYFMRSGYSVAQFFDKLRGEYAMVITVENKITGITDIYMGTDPLSVRPLYYQEINDFANPLNNASLRQNEFQGLIISSILKGLSDGTNEYNYKVSRLDSGEYRHYVYNPNIKNGIKKIMSDYHHEFIKPILFKQYENDELYSEIDKYLREAVACRISNTDVPYCALLSGGLDSSLVVAYICDILKKRDMGEVLSTFAIGMEGSEDLKFAKIVADFLGTKHTEIIYTHEEALSIIPYVIKCVESFDTTTIRASVAQYLLAKYISQNTNFKVVLNGDGSDEINMGYMYFHLSPNAYEAQLDSSKLIKNIYRFDGQRVDRCISNWGLEARVPFLDVDYITLMFNVNYELKVPTKDRMEKYLLRKTIEVIHGDNFLPKCVLWRKKEAFSDGVSYKNKPWYLIAKEYTESKYTKEEFDGLLQLLEKSDPYCLPETIEEGYYRSLFIKYYGIQSDKTIPYYWRPNWTSVKDPSAKALTINVQE